MDNVIMFRRRERMPRKLETFKASPHTQFLPIKIDGDVPVHELWRALHAAGLALQVDASGSFFIIAKARQA
jgi:hypothetical protein